MASRTTYRNICLTVTEKPWSVMLPKAGDNKKKFERHNYYTAKLHPMVI